MLGVIRPGGTSSVRTRLVSNMVAFDENESLLNDAMCGLLAASEGDAPDFLGRSAQFTCGKEMRLSLEKYN
jgi:hypothetical protein